MGLTFQELLVVGIIAIVLFGKRLPEVARTLGQQYSKFRKSLNELQSQVNLHEIYDPRSTPSTSSTKKIAYREVDDYEEATSPRFEPPPTDAPASATPSDS
jgi:sec-independent protein translocase protein TatA